MSWPAGASTTVPLCGQLDRAAGVVAVHERLDVGAGRVGARVHVGDQADRRAGAGQRGGDVPVLVERGIRQADRVSSSTSSRERSSWPGVLGDCVRSRVDWVSMRT